MVLSSMEVAWATDVAVGYRRPVRGGPLSSGLRPLAIEVVLQDRVDASVGAGAGLKRTRAGGGPVPGGLVPRPIEFVLQDGGAASVGAGADLKRPRAGGLEPPGPVR